MKKNIYKGGNGSIVTVAENDTSTEGITEGDALAFAIALDKIMASAFKTATSASIGTSLTTIYTCPSGTTSTIIGLYLCNQSGGAIEANVEFYDASAQMHTLE